MLKSASTEAKVHTRLEQWDADKWALNVHNGIIDLRTQTFRERTQNDLCRKQSPIVYDPNATCPKWDAAVNMYMCGRESDEVFADSLGLQPYQ